MNGEEDSDGFCGRLVCAEPNGTYGPRMVNKDVAKGKRSKIHMYLPNKKIEDPEGQMTSMKAMV